MPTKYDVVTFGETMLRLSPPHHQRFIQAQAVDIHVGGSESNVAVGLARLGARVAWFSALPKNQLGDYVERKINNHHVDTSHIVWSDEGRLGIYWVEQGASPRSSQVVYDRTHTAISQMIPEQLPDNLFQKDHAKLLHISGITPALSISAHETTFQALQLAKEAGWEVSFDLNYRAKLWDASSAKIGCTPFVEQADIVFAPERDIQTIFGIQGKSQRETLQQFRQKCPEAIVIMTVGSEGAMACLPDTDIIHVTGYEATAVDRIGAGDAFVAGFLSQVIEHSDNFNLENALRWANAMAALNYTVQGDFPLITREEVLALIDETSQQHIQR